MPKNAKIQRKEDNTNKQKINDKVVDFNIWINKHEFELTKKAVKILKNVRHNGVPLSQKEDISIAGIINKGLKTILNLYLNQVFTNDAVVKQFQVLNNDTLKDFIEFRAQYMDMPVEQQFDNFVKMGIINMRPQPKTGINPQSPKEIGEFED